MSYVTPRRARQIRAELQEVADLEGRPFPDWSRVPRFTPSRIDTPRIVAAAEPSGPPSLFDLEGAPTN